MIDMKKIFLVIIFCLFTSYSVFAETSLWKLQSGESTLYLAGSLHLLRKSDYPLPEEFERAYKKSDMIVFETDIKELNKPETQHLLMSKGVYNDGTTLDKILSPEAYGILKKYCEENEMPIDYIKNMKPWMAIITLTVIELVKMGVDQSGVDLYFYSKANADGKKTTGLEEIEEHINIISSIDADIENDFIIYSINDLKKSYELFNEINTAWKKGDENGLSEIFLKEMRKETPKLYKSLITDRNNSWLSKIKSYIKTPHTEMVIVGVAHLVGKDGVIELLKKQGFKIKKLDIKK